MAEQLTKLESSVYHYLLDFTAENTYQPSIRDIGKQFKIKSTKTVSDLLQSLARKGYIERDPARSRGVNLLGFGAALRTQPVPFYGRIHAGEPALVPEHRQGFITVDRRFVPSDDVFFLKVKGERRRLRDGKSATGPARPGHRRGAHRRRGDGKDLRSPRRLGSPRGGKPG